jgi:hypothetical protein
MIVTADLAKVEAEKEALVKRVKVINAHFDKELSRYDNKMYEIEMQIDEMEGKLMHKTAEFEYISEKADQVFSVMHVDKVKVLAKH